MIMSQTFKQKQPDLYCLEAIKLVTSLVKVHREYSPGVRILHKKNDQACDVIFMASK